MISPDTLRIFLLVAVLHQQPMYMHIRVEQFDRYLDLAAQEHARILRRARFLSRTLAAFAALNLGVALYNLFWWLDR